jgi:benzoyl-CoA reductase subunit C
MTLAEIVDRAEALYQDADLEGARRFRSAGGRVVGCAPAYVPDEIIDAAGALPLHLLGSTPGVEVIQGDALFQSAICHLPRSLVDLGLRGVLDPLDLLVVPSTCDVLRNMTGMWKVLWPDRAVFFLDLPQRPDDVGFAFYREQLEALRAAVARATGAAVSDADLGRAVATGNRRRRLIRELFALRAREPSRVPTSELYVVLRAGALLAPGEHVEMLAGYADACRGATRPPLDVARVVLSGAFCEQPPLAFIRTLERAGCAIVGDDLLLGLRWLLADVDERVHPLDALARAYLADSPAAPCRYEWGEGRPDAVLRAVREHRAEGVVVASPSFCDIALLDRPALLRALEQAGVPSVQLQYAENSADFGAVREQAGTFADALRLWSEAS